MATSFNLQWIDIALNQEALARTARRQSEAVSTREPVYGIAVREEMHASMIGISASAHAIDALYGTIKPRVTLPDQQAQAWSACRPKRPKRHSRILETLKHGCELGKYGHDWVPEFEWLFELRDQAVHHATVFHPTAAHPTGKTHVTKEGAQYVLAELTRAVNLAVQVSVLSIELARPEQQRLHSWAQNELHVAAALRTRRPQAF